MKLTYTKAYTELEKIVGAIEDDKIKVDELAEKIKEANVMIKYCEEKLRGITEEIKKSSES